MSLRQRLTVHLRSWAPHRKLAEIIAKLGIRTIVLAIPRSRSTRITRRILEARLLGAEIMDMPQLYQRLTTKLPVQYLEDQWLLFSDGFNLLSRGYVQRIKRILDFIFAALLLCRCISVNGDYRHCYSP